MTKFLAKKRELNAQELLDYFKAHGFRFMSWGANNFLNIKNKALRFKVNGHHHKGYVYVACNGTDLMDFVLVSTHGNIKHIQSDLYIDQLFDAIDKKVEFIEEYQR